MSFKDNVKLLNESKHVGLWSSDVTCQDRPDWLQTAIEVSSHIDIQIDIDIVLPIDFGEVLNLKNHIKRFDGIKGSVFGV
jgi:hypothetical protein